MYTKKIPKIFWHTLFNYFSMNIPIQVNVPMDKHMEFVKGQPKFLPNCEFASNCSCCEITTIGFQHSIDWKLQLKLNLKLTHKKLFW
jgi:hypothetical protein